MFYVNSLPHLGSKEFAEVVVGEGVVESRVDGDFNSGG